MKRLILLLALCFSSLAGFSPQSYQQTKQKLFFEAKKHLFLNGIYLRPLTSEALTDALYYCEIIEPQIAYKQALIETGWFTSPLCTQGNNVFGMRLAKIRPTTATGEMDHHATYDHWFDSVRDYKLLQEYYAARGYNFNEYLIFLEDIGYATDKNYIRKINSISEKS